MAAACLAQAQQCFLYIADASGKPKKLLAKLAKAVSDKYIDAMAALRNGLVRERVMCGGGGGGRGVCLTPHVMHHISPTRRSHHWTPEPWS